MKEKRKHPLLYEQVLKIIEEEIISGKYKKGDLLPSEKELTEKMGVSRITVRKALSILSEIGFIKKVKGRGSMVIFQMEDMVLNKWIYEEMKECRRSFEESTEIRLMLEPEIARQVALSASEEQIAQLKEISLLTQKDWPTNNFHLFLVAILDNQALKEIIGELVLGEETMMSQIVLNSGRKEDHRKIAYIEHEKILEAIIAKDGELAYYYMKKHIECVKEIYKEYFARIDKIKEIKNI